MGRSNYVHLEGCTVVALTDKAVLLRYDGEQYWIPLMQLAEGEAEKLKRGDNGLTVSVSEWICEQKGIEVE